MNIHAKRVITCVVAYGFLLAASSSVASAQRAPKTQRQFETAACKLISVLSKPAPGAFEAISVPISELLALKKTQDRSLRDVVSEYDSAASADNTVAMIRALANGAKV